MATRTHGARRRSEGLSSERIDGAGETGLPFRVLTERLETGPAESDGSPREEIHAVALALLAMIDRHPWLAAQLLLQLSRSPGGPVAPRILEAFGKRVRALDVPDEHWFTVTSVLMHYVLGAAGQNAANGQAAEPAPDRAEFLATTAKRWEERAGAASLCPGGRA